MTATDTIDPATTISGDGGHPLDRLTPDEMNRAVEIIKASEQFHGRMRFASLGLHPPAKGDVLAFIPGGEIDRQADAILLDNTDGSVVEMTVSVTSGEVTSHERLTGVQPAVILNEFFESEETIRTDPGFIAAMANVVSPT